MHNALLFLFLLPLGLTAQVEDPDPTRFAAAMQKFASQDEEQEYLQTEIVFVGSSSIRMWDTEQYFSDLDFVNRGFGGSHLSDANHYLDETVLRYQPEIIVLYEGDNDSAADKTPEQILEDYLEFKGRVREDNPEVKIIFLPIKPSLARWEIWDVQKETNALIESDIKKDDRAFYLDVATPMLNSSGEPQEQLFIEDGLHMNERGYNLWSRMLRTMLEELSH